MGFDLRCGEYEQIPDLVAVGPKRLRLRMHRVTDCFEAPHQCCRLPDTKRNGICFNPGGAWTDRPAARSVHHLQTIRLISVYAPFVFSVMVTSAVPRLRQNQPCFPSNPASKVP